MIKREFEVAEHEDFGLLGLRPVSMPHADPIPGMGAAHDVLEHFAGDDGGVAAEFQALGASIFVRGYGYYHHLKGSHNTSPGYHISADFPELYSHVMNEGFLFGPPPGREGTRPIADDEEVEDFISEACRRGAREIREGFAGGVQVQPFTSAARRWMRIGYRRAVRRYSHTTSTELAHLFIDIESQVDLWLERLEEGDRVVIRADVRALRASVRPVYGYERGW